MDITARTQRRRRLVALPVLALIMAMVPVVAAAQAEAGSSSTKGSQSQAAKDKARGLNYAGLVKKTSGPCAGDYQLDLPGKRAVCTHGPDPAPAGVDVTAARDLSSISSTTSTTTAPVPCIGDGTSGTRVQYVYAVASDQTDNYATLVPTFNTIAGEMDDAVNTSAAQTGGTRHIRFVTNSDCSLNVAHVVLSPTGDDTFSNTISELQAKGFTASSRKYLVMVDASLYCGIAQVFQDDSAGSTNMSNTNTSYARVDRGCWGRSDHLSELHELMHTLGSVQPTAPHGTANFHCWDEYDAMCYQDSPTVVMTYPCASANEWYLDCGHDDYFSTAPAAGSYLDTHWNTANSVFLSTSLSDTTPAPAPSPTPTTVVQTFTGSVSAKKTTVSFVLTSGSGSSSSALTFTASGKVKTAPSLKLQILNADGTVLAQGSGPSVLNLAATMAATTYKLVVSGTSSVSFTLSVTHPSA